MTAKKPVCWPSPSEQQLLAAFGADGQPISRTAKTIANLTPKLTRAELEELMLWATLDELASADPKKRHEILSKLGTCPCCDRWVGHNNAPPDETKESGAGQLRLL